MNRVLDYFPDKLKIILMNEIRGLEEELEEIRFRVNRPIILKFNNFEKKINFFVNNEEVLSILHLICENSIYSYQKQISEGFITLKGGHRVGITGSCVIENGKVININYISSLNFRISKQMIDCSKKILKYVLDLENNNVFNTLIVSPPGYGKTTILRDLVRQISNGNKDLCFDGINVGVVDERGEIAGLYKGIPQNDVGIKTDVVENVSKSIGIRMLVRSMAPKVVVADEIGNIDDIETINFAMCSGCKGIFSAHGASFEDLCLNPILKKLIDNCAFEVLLFLDRFNRGELREIYTLDKLNLKYKIL